MVRRVVAVASVAGARRGGLRYVDFVNYLRKLRRQSYARMLVLGQGDLRWSLIDFEEIQVLDHRARAGLQLADVGAGAFFQAVERNRPDDCDPQYAKLLRPVVARDAYGNRLGFGIKTMPLPHEMRLAPEQRELFEFYGYDPGRVASTRLLIPPAHRSGCLARIGDSEWSRRACRN